MLVLLKPFLKAVLVKIRAHDRNEWGGGGCFVLGHIHSAWFLLYDETARINEQHKQVDRVQYDRSDLWFLYKKNYTYDIVLYVNLNGKAL